MIKEFREFLEEFNVIPLAVGLVLALAFAPMVTAVVDLVLSVVAALIGMQPDKDGIYDFAGGLQPGGFQVGAVINALITFVMIAFIVFMIVRLLAKAGANTTPAQTPDQALLAEIRDALKSR